MPSGPCRFSGPIAPVRMLRMPFSDWVMTIQVRSTPKASAVSGPGVTVAGR